MKIVLVAEEAAGIQTLRRLEQSQHEIIAVLTASSKEVDAKRGSTVAGLAASLGIPTWSAKLVKQASFANTLKENNIDILLNVHSLYIIHGEVVAAPKIGSFNLHPGDLPEHAGMNAPSWAVFKGQTEHGVSLHWMTAGIDTGDIAYQERFALSEKDTGLSVSTKCVRLGVQLIEQLLNEEPQAIPKIKQDLSKRVYHGFEVPFKGKIDWTQDAQSLERFIRASDFYPLPSPWGTPTTSLNGKAIGILKVNLSEEASQAKAGSIKIKDEKVYVATTTNWLELKKVIFEDKVLNAIEVLKEADVLGLVESET